MAPVTKKYIFLMTFLPVSFFGYSQKNDPDTLNPLSLKIKTYKLAAERIAPTAIKLPFSSIKIIDSRYDTSKMGFKYYSAFFGSGFRIVKLDKGTAKSIEDYYNDYYQHSFQNNGFSLLIVMKTFWLSVKHGEKTNNLDISSFASIEYNSLKCKWEYYLEKGGQYMPIQRVDTLWQFSEELQKLVKEETEERYIGDFKFMLKALIEKYDFDKVISNFNEKGKKTIEEITAFNERRANIPILKDTGYRKGIYLSFEEFKNNSPSISEFKERKMEYSQGFKKDHYLEDMKGNAITSYWGYFDGNDFKYGKFGNDKIYRIGNAFEFLTKLIGPAVSENSVFQNRSRKPIIPYQIEMETGEVY